MTTATSIPDLYARVKAACPEACPPQVSVVGGIFQLAIECTDVGHCASWSWATDATMPVVESLILAACVRWLADNSSVSEIIKVRGDGDSNSFYRITIDGPDPHWVDTENNNLTIAAMLAVEAVCKERGQ